MASRTQEDIESLIQDMTLVNRTSKDRRETTQASPISPSGAEKKDFVQKLNERLAQKPGRRRTSQGFGKTAIRGQLSTPTASNSTLFVLGYPNEVLGIFSTVEKGVAAAAILCKVYGSQLDKWNDSGMRVWGQLRLLPKCLGLPKSDDFEDFEDVESQKNTFSTMPSSVYAALQAGLCLGVFVDKPDAWEACLKHKTQVTYSTKLEEESKWVDKEGMPHIEGVLSGSGWHRWSVKRYAVNAIE